MQLREKIRGEGGFFSLWEVCNITMNLQTRNRGSQHLTPKFWALKYLTSNLLPRRASIEDRRHMTPIELFPSL